MGRRETWIEVRDEAKVFVLAAGLIWFQTGAVAEDGIDLPLEPLQPLPQTVLDDSELTQKKVSLGESLFFDPRLSKDDTVSCATCHDLTKGGTDQLAVSVGVDGAEGDINAPTVFNSVFNLAQFWDGRAHDLAEQAAVPVENPVEMAFKWSSLVAKLRRDEDYVAQFSDTYGEIISKENILDAIAVYESSLITPNSRFDRYLNGDTHALSQEEKDGYGLFKSLGCSSCHQGRNIGGNMFQKFGVMRDYFEDRGLVTKADYGRFNVTGAEEDRYVFKVPSLRNIALTPPYFHDASVDNLDAAVEVMAFYQLGRLLTTEERDKIVAFLKTLTGEFKSRPL